MNKTQGTKASWGLYLLSAGIPFAIIALVYCLLNCVPFGSKTVLFMDSSYQYVNFASYLRTIFDGTNNVLYTFSKNMGGELLSLLSYYLSSPFSLLFVLATDETMPLIFTLVGMLKMSACGVTFFWSVSRRFGLRSCWLIFSTAYALMAYNVMYAWNIMWLDGVLILPLLALGLEQLWDGKSPLLYGASLAYGLLTNFYIGYMLCITSVLFSIALVLSKQSGLRSKAVCFGRFALASCLGGFSTAAVWLPTFLSLLSGRASAASTGFTMATTFNVLGLAGKLVPGITGWDQLCFGTPHIYCGVFTVYLLLCFFLNGGSSLRSRMIPLGVMGVLVLSFLFRGIDMVWHGFSPNNAYNFRYSFVLSYVLLMSAVYAWEDRKEMKRWVFAAAGGLMAALIAGLMGMKYMLHLNFISLLGLAVAGAVIVIVAMCLLLEKKYRRVLPVVLAAACIAETAANYYLCMDGLVREVHFMDQASLQSFAGELRPALEYVEDTDSGFYRLEKDFYYNQNDPMFYGYNGLSHFSSSQQKRDLHFLEILGLTKDQDIWAYYRKGSTAGTDALLGVRYLLTKADIGENKNYQHITDVGNVKIYRNLYALPIAMVSDGKVLDVSMAELDYFATHNAIWSGISGLDTPLMYSAQGVEVTLENLQVMEGEEGCTLCIRSDAELPAAIRFDIPVTQAKPLYFYFTSVYAQNASVRINGQDNGKYFQEMRWDMTYAGTYEIGDAVTIEIVPHGEEFQLRDALFYYEDLTALAAHSTAITARPVTIVRESSSHLTGSFEAREDQVLLFTIPYDTGWRIYVDGQRQVPQLALDALLSIPVEAGQHTFELRYIPRGLIAGGCLSAGALLAAGVWLLLRRKRI